MKAENNLIAFIAAIRDFLEGIKDVHIESFLADWPSANCITRSVLPHRLPVLSWLSAAVKAADKKTEGIVKMLAAQANHIAWGQTYSAQDFGVEFLEKYGWTEFIGKRGPITSKHASWVPHAMRTETVPLIALYLWRGGNLVQKSLLMP